MSKRRHSLRTRFAVTVLLVGAVASGVWLLSEFSTVDDGDPETIGACTTITEPGHYEVTADVRSSSASTCIRVRSSDVVLDGGGHRIDGTGSFGTAGIVVRPEGNESLANVTVRDLTVSDWDNGIRYFGVDDGAVVGTVTRDNRVGLSLLDAHGHRLRNNVARDNRLRGISLLESSTDNVLVDNTATGNDLYGIHLVEGGVRNNTLRSNTATDNEFGVVLIGVRDNVLTDTAANDNRIAGIWLSASTGNSISSSTVSNRFYGVLLSDRSSENTITDTVAASNEVGIRLRSSDGNLVANNTVRGSGDNAILLLSSDDNAVSGNTGSNNARGVTTTRSADNSVENNSLAAP